VNPVILASGCARLATKPLLTGSVTFTKAIGILRVALLSAMVTGVP
jgi:hypothetical protein